MTCADVDILLAEYVEGTLRGAQRSAVETHLAECAECAELARDAAGAIGFIERAAVVDAPPALVTKILYEITDGPSRAQVKPSWTRKLFGRWIDSLLQPRYAMSMALTVLSFAMLGRFSGIEVRQLRPADLDPVKVWTTTEAKVHRSWERTVKYYENLRVVYEIQSQLKEWSDQQPPAADSNGSK